MTTMIEAVMPDAMARAESGRQLGYRHSHSGLPSPGLQMERSRSASLSLVDHGREGSVLRSDSLPCYASQERALDVQRPGRVLFECGSPARISTWCEQTARPKVDMVRQPSGILYGAKKNAPDPRMLPPPSAPAAVRGDVQRAISADLGAGAHMWSPASCLSSRMPRSKSTGLSEERVTAVNSSFVRVHRRMTSPGNTYKGSQDAMRRASDPCAIESRSILRALKWPGRRQRLSLDSANTDRSTSPSSPAALDPQSSADSILLLNLLNRTGVLGETLSSPTDSYASWSGREPQDDLCCSPTKASPAGTSPSVCSEPVSPGPPVSKSLPVSPASKPLSPWKRFASSPGFFFLRCTTAAADVVEERTHMPIKPCAMAAEAG